RQEVGFPALTVGTSEAGTGHGDGSALGRARDRRVRLERGVHRPDGAVADRGLPGGPSRNTSASVAWLAVSAGRLGGRAGGLGRAVPDVFVRGSRCRRKPLLLQGLRCLLVRDPWAGTEQWRCA